MDALLSGEDTEGIGAKLKVRQRSLKKMSTTGLNIAHDTIVTNSNNSTKSNTNTDPKSQSQSQLKRQDSSRRGSKGIDVNDGGGDDDDSATYNTPKSGRDGTRKKKPSYHGTAWTSPTNNSNSNAPSSSSAVVVPTATSSSESPQRFTLSRRQSSRGMIGKLISYT